MLAKKYRLNRKQINLIYKKGSGKREGVMGIKFLSNNESFSRYSVIIPKAVVKKVTERNRLRRIIFDELSRLKPAQNADTIVRVFRIADETTLRKNTRDLIKNINV
jgi:ribonuclease P protein component